MRQRILALGVLMIIAGAPAAFAEDLSGVKVEKVEIVPNSEKDVNSLYFRGRPVVEAAANSDSGAKPGKVAAEAIQLPTYRSYRLIVTIGYPGNGKAPSSFTVRTDCVRDGKTVTLGKARVGFTKSVNTYACYDVFPAEADTGDCVIRTVVVGDDDTKKPDAKPASPGLEFKARIQK